MRALLADQITAIDKLRQYKVGALFMEPGTGKTRTTYELVKSVPECDYILWLTPFQTKDNLRREIDLCGGLDVRIEGIESLSNSDRIYLELTADLQSSKTPFIVVDESLKIKNWEAKRTKRILELGKIAEYKLLLNGTPLSRNILDLWAQMEFLSPRILNMGTAEYKNTFCEWTRYTKRIGHKVQVREWITKYHNVDYLYSLIGHYVYECDLKLESQRQYHVIEYRIDPESKSEYNELKEKYLDKEMMLWKNNNIFLEMTQKMQHTYCCTAEKIQALKSILRVNPESSVIVYCKYIASSDMVSKMFPDVIVLTYGKHSLGLNLQEKSVIVFFDKTWDYAQRIQTERRIWRTGQQSDCIYYDLTGDVGLESLIDRNINQKKNLLEYFKKTGVEQIRKEL